MTAHSEADQVIELLPLVGLLVRKAGIYGRNRDDAFQEGCIGLIRAVRTHDADGGGASMASWAAIQIESKLLDWKRRMSGSRRVGETPAIFLSVEEWMLLDRVSPSPEEHIADVFAARFAIAAMFGALSPRDAAVVARRLDGAQLSVIAEEFGISEVRCSQIVGGAMAKARKFLD